MTSLWTSGEAYSLACALLWAVAVILFRKGTELASPLVLNLFKNVVGASLLWLSMAVLGVAFAPPERDLGDWALVALSGMLGISVADTMLFASLEKLGAGGSAIVGCLYAPLVTVVAFALLGEPIGWPVTIAMILVSVAIVLGTFATEPGQRTKRERIHGVLLGIAANALMAVGIVIVKPVLLVSDPWWIAAMRLTAALPLLVVLSLTPRFRAETLRVFTPGKHWTVLLTSAFIGAYLALILWIAGFKHTLAGVASILNQTSTLAIIVLAAIFLGERLTWRKAVAVLLGIVGVLVVVL